MLNGLACVIRLRVSFSEKLVSLNLFLFISCLLAQIKELFAILDGTIQFTLSLVDHTDLLVALGLDVLVLSSLGHQKTLLEELERHVKLKLLQILVGDQLVDTYQVF